MSQQTAIVIRSTRLNGGGWSAVIKPEGKPKTFAATQEDHPEGTRLTLVDGEWRKL